MSMSLRASSSRRLVTLRFGIRGRVKWDACNAREVRICGARAGLVAGDKQTELCGLPFGSNLLEAAPSSVDGAWASLTVCRRFEPRQGARVEATPRRMSRRSERLAVDGV